MVGRAIQRDGADMSLPSGVFSLLFGGGFALARIAARCPEPIPVYAETSSINPVPVRAARRRQKTKRAA